MQRPFLSVTSSAYFSSTFQLAQTNMFPAILRCQVSSRSFAPYNWASNRIDPALTLFDRLAIIIIAIIINDNSHKNSPRKNIDPRPERPERRGQRTMMTSNHTISATQQACTLTLRCTPRFPFPSHATHVGTIGTKCTRSYMPLSTAYSHASQPRQVGSGVFSTIGSSSLYTYLEAPVERRRLVTEGRIGHPFSHQQRVDLKLRGCFSRGPCSYLSFRWCRSQDKHGGCTRWDSISLEGQRSS